MCRCGQTKRTTKAIVVEKNAGTRTEQTCSSLSKGRECMCETDPMLLVVKTGPVAEVSISLMFVLSGG